MAMPKGPSMRKESVIHPDRAKDGSSSVYIHTRNPAMSPVSAPLRLAPFQKMPTRIAGANWAAAAKDTRPMVTRA